MDDAHRVRLGDALRGLADVVDRHLHRQRVALLELCPEIVADQELHRDVRLAVGEAIDVVDARDVRRPKTGRGLRLLSEARDRGDVLREVGLQDLDRKALLEMKVLRFVDEAHAARAEQSIDAVLPGEGRALG